MDKGKGKSIVPNHPLPNHPPPFYRNYPRFPRDDNPNAEKTYYKNLSPYIQKSHPLHICYLEQSPAILDQLDPCVVASNYFPLYSHFHVISGKTRYFYELVLQDMLSCQITHNYSGNTHNNAMRYPEIYET